MHLYSPRTYCACAGRQEQQQWFSSRGHDSEGLPVRVADPSGTPSPAPGSSNFFFCWWRVGCHCLLYM